MLAVDAGSNQISVLRTNRDGSLTQVPGSPVSSGGVKPVSIAVHDHLVYVANDGDATHSANYTGFFLTPFRPTCSATPRDRERARSRQ